MMTQYTFAACGQRNATVTYEHAPMIRARQVAQANTHLEDEGLIEKVVRVEIDPRGTKIIKNVKKEKL